MLNSGPAEGDVSDDRREDRQRGRPAAGGRRGAAAVDYGLLTELVGYHLRRAQAKVFEDFMRTMVKDGVTPGQFGVLTLIGSNPGASQSTIAKAIGVERSTMVAVIDTLQERGLVDRRVSETDKRSYALRLTEDGAALTTRLRKRVRTHERRIASALSGEEKATLIELLRRIGRS
jgi:DNA-binding MarR family transcriptional regulator